MKQAINNERFLFQFNVSLDDRKRKHAFRSFIICGKVFPLDLTDDFYFRIPFQMQMN